MFLLFVLTILLPSHLVSGAKPVSPPPLTPYESVRALNEYGQTIQIQNAQSAVDTYGRTIVALRIDKDTVWIVSPLNPPPSFEKKSKNRRLLEPITAHSHLVCTGIQPDSEWLLMQLREYGRNMLRQLDCTVLDPTAVAQIHRRFLGYDLNRMWKGLAVATENEDAQTGRPLGVASFLVSIKDEGVSVHHVDTSGFIRTIGKANYSFMSTGRGSEIVEQTLKFDDERNIEECLLQAFELAVGCKELRIEVVSSDGSINGRVLRR